MNGVAYIQQMVDFVWDCSGGGHKFRHEGDPTPTHLRWRMRTLPAPGPLVGGHQPTWRPRLETVPGAAAPHPAAHFGPAHGAADHARWPHLGAGRSGVGSAQSGPAPLALALVVFAPAACATDGRSGVLLGGQKSRLAGAHISALPSDKPVTLGSWPRNRTCATPTMP